MSHSSPMGGYSSWASSLALLVLIKTESQTSHSTRNIGWYSDICPSKCSRGSAVHHKTTETSNNRGRPQGGREMGCWVQESARVWALLQGHIPL